ncbi:histidine phosphatase family protein [Corynebacterium freneyi]|uniref:histidine phosphatase family protein n=1 Tax=Corynebacterium freneyi TaxID=134034 RepID=UPI001EF3CD56|nr:histidine phosphatase family protein [Corynebacterium freneyi]MCG7440198.1 histidine phosphatase family protein [Corynebacterium freneyi]MDK8768172.1 histidine phosphatase family protein [Corynebacterium freneyi]
MESVAARRLLLLRHGETTYNATRRMQGQLDTELSEEGVAQAERVAAHVGRRERDIRRIVSSDLSRAAQTADVVGRVLGVDVERDSRLRETFLGQWQGRTHGEIDAEYPGQRATWRHDATWAPPGGETRVEVAARMRAVVDELLDDDSWPGSTVLLVAHGGAIAALTASLLDVPVSHYTMFNGLRNTAWVELTARPRPDGELGWYLGAFNAEVFGEETGEESER